MSSGSKSAGYGVWITTGGASIRGHAFSLPILNILCQTFRMKNLNSPKCNSISDEGINSEKHLESVVGRRYKSERSVDTYIGGKNE